MLQPFFVLCAIRKLLYCNQQNNFFLNFVAVMRRIKQILSFMKGMLKRYISPAFVVLFCASFILWYILKLGNTYVTEYDIKVEIAGHTIAVPCRVQAFGTDLLDVRKFTRRSLNIPLRELEYSVESYVEEGDTAEFYVISPHSMRSAISSRFKAVKDISVGPIPPVPVSEKE